MEIEISSSHRQGACCWTEAARKVRLPKTNIQSCLFPQSGASICSPAKNAYFPPFDERFTFQMTCTAKSIFHLFRCSNFSLKGLLFLVSCSGFVLSSQYPPPLLVNPYVGNTAIKRMHAFSSMSKFPIISEGTGDRYLLTYTFPSFLKVFQIFSRRYNDLKQVK